MKKEKKACHIYDNSEASERQYRQKLKADQYILQIFFNSFSHCYWMPFYSSCYGMFAQTDLIVNQSKNNANNDCKNK